MKRKARKPAESGGNGLLWLGAGVVLACVLLMVVKRDGVKPVGPDNNPGGPDLVQVFLSNPNKVEAKADAISFGEIAGSVADVLAFDGTQGDKARIKTGYMLAVFRSDSRHLATRGQSFAVKYPAIKDVVEKYLDEKAGKDGDSLSDASRKDWIEAFRAIERSALWASRKI